jgi:3-dehydroquinate dehydratase
VKLSQLPRPFLCCVLLDERSPDELMRTIRLAEADGAHAFELDLQVLPPAARTPDALAPVFASTPRPVFTVYRRVDHSAAESHRLAPDDDERVEAQVELVRRGSAGVDLELDAFDPQPGPWFASDEGLRYSYDPASPPREVSTDPDADRRQREVVDEVHRLGGEVILSAHALTRLPVEEALRIGRLAEARGADIVKIVRLCTSYEDVVETMTATVALRSELEIPFVMMGMGEYGRLTRLLAPMLGSLLVFCRQTYSPGSFLDQPLIRNARAVLENVELSIAPRAASFLPPELR